SMKLTGDPVALFDDMRLGSLGSVDLAVTTGGTLLYGSGGGRGKFQLAWMTRDGQSQPIDSAWQGLFFDPSLSPDGKRAALAIANPQEYQVWIKPLDKSPAVRLTFDGTENFRPAWTPDGSFLT